MENFLIMMLTALLTTVKDTCRVNTEGEWLHLGSNDNDSHWLVDDTRNFLGLAKVAQWEKLKESIVDKRTLLISSAVK